MEVQIMEKFYTLAETKDYLKISDSTIRRHIREGKIESQKLGRQYRFTESAIRAYINEQGKQNKEEQDND